MAFDVELVRIVENVLVVVGRQVPHQDLVVLLDLLAAQLGVFGCGATHIGQRRDPTDHLGHEAAHQPGIILQLLPLVGEQVQAVHTARHGVAGRVVTTDDQQQQVAELFHRGHVLGVLAVGEHRHEVETVTTAALIPQFGEVRHAFHQFVDLLLLGFDHTARLRNSKHDV